jgi:DNA-binding transcriptional LysR family regulator
MLVGPLPIEGEGLNLEPLFREPLRLVAPPDHPLTRGPATREALAGAPILSLDRRHHLHRQVAGLCAEYGMRLLRDYEGTSLDSIQADGGFRALPRHPSGLLHPLGGRRHRRRPADRGGRVDGHPQHRRRMARWARLTRRPTKPSPAACRRWHAGSWRADLR